MICFIDHGPQGWDIFVATDQPHQARRTPTWPLLCTLWNSYSGLQRESDVSLSLCFLCLHFCIVGGQRLELRRGCMARRAGRKLGTASPYLSPKEGVLWAPLPSSLLAPIHRGGCLSEQLHLMSSWAAVYMSQSRQPPVAPYM